MKVPMWQVHGSWATAFDHNPYGRRNHTHFFSRHSLARFHADWDRILKEVLA